MTETYRLMREYLDTVPIIDTHAHYISSYTNEDVFDLMMGYLKSDFRVTGDSTDRHIVERIIDKNLPFEDRYAMFEELYKKCSRNSYAKAMVRGLKEVWGIEGVSYEELLKLQELIKTRSNEKSAEILRSKHVKAQIADIFESRLFGIIDGTDTDYTDLSVYAFPLPCFHRLYNFDDLRAIEDITHRIAVTLDEYVDMVDELIEKAVKWGVVCLKDQSAYFRGLDYECPTRDQAERIYNKLVCHPLEPIGAAEGKPLDDWLFRHFLRTAARLGVTVQIHTGLQDRCAGAVDRVGGDIRSVNAVNLMPILESNRDVNFDLFHGSWPYMDEILYLAKNFPNAYIDLCWVQNIDPDYAVEMMKRAVKVLPGTKIMGFGCDSFFLEPGIGYLEQAKDNMAKALSDLVEEEWLTLEEAKETAMDWMYNNPKRLFHLNDR